MSGGASRLTRAQQALVEAALPRVRKMARVFCFRHPAANEEELFAAGAAAAVGAALRYEPTREVRFDVFCWSHVLGAMQELFAETRPASRLALAVAQRAGLSISTSLTAASDPFGNAEEEPGARVAEACAEVALAMVAGLTSAASSSVEEQAIAREERARAFGALRREFAALSAEERLILELRFVQGRPVREVAAALGTSRPTAGRRCRDLMDKLRRRLEQQGVTGVPAASDLDGAGMDTA
ncbi:sigma-70 family RNA polymerase sigma factor [Chondromyces apiculatus]|uniref:RNA polymerase sigma-70 region 4 domain-containing protein n=1 Tax=Chondromyces apiculatus DSM 436 TaxID=1192034 RepID=A0A017TA78_9BACT|nr:sigma-70 family RNA polymerase sigma factor [Chondromyces apiculatus]EYF06178.1 Hypothetical protein CAP_2368 [Chondromyces apiculatus DSM 436]